MGSGKSSVGKRLAKKLHVPFVDTDMEVEKMVGKSVTEIFAEHGEGFFREKETEVLELLGNKPGVIATGGGLPCFNENMKRMNQAGITVYIQLSPRALHSRLINKRENRPLIAKLSDAELLKFIETKLADREPIYRLAKITVDGLNNNLTELVEKVIF